MNNQEMNPSKNHVCNILKDFTKELYSYPKENWVQIIFVYLDYVLVCNQHITNTFTTILRTELPDFYEQYPGGLFPKYLHDFDENIVKNNADRIISEIDEIEPSLLTSVPELRHNLSKFDLLDLRTPYKCIIEILKYKNDPIVERAEYGYYIGSLLHIMMNKYLEKYDKNSPVWLEPNWDILDKRVCDFRPGVFSNL